MTFSKTGCGFWVDELIIIRNSTPKMQAAYPRNPQYFNIDSRYREDYNIGVTDLLELTERVRIIQDILAESSKTIFQKKDDE